MDWKDEEKRTLHHAAEAAFIGVREWDPAVREDCNNRNVTRGLHVVAEAIATRAVELVAARGGTTPDAVRMFVVLGARNAVLETERDEARSKVSALHAAAGCTSMHTALAAEANCVTHAILAARAELECRRNPRCQREECKREREAADRFEKQVEELKAERDSYREKMLSEGGKFLAEMQRADRLQEQLVAAQHEVARTDAALRVVAPDLIARLTSSCVWCGEESPQALKPKAISQHIQDHLQSCPSHPMRELERRVAELHRSFSESQSETHRLQDNEADLRTRLRAEQDGNREFVRRAQDAEGKVEKLTREAKDARGVLQKVDGERERLGRVEEKIQVLRDGLSGIMRAGVELAKELGEPAKQPTCAPCADHECEVHPSSEWGSPASVSAELRASGHGATIAQRYPCGPTCTHDDAAKPGHPERVMERSEAVKDGLEAGKAMVRESFEQGAEAMRAACLNVVQFEMEKRGASREEWESMKSAIEGAAP